MHLSAEESIQRYSTIESESGIEFFDSVGFLSIWKKIDLSPEYLEEIKNRAEETRSVLVTDDYSAKHFPYLRYKLTYNISQTWRVCDTDKTVNRPQIFVIFLWCVFCDVILFSQTRGTQLQ